MIRQLKGLDFDVGCDLAEFGRWYPCILLLRKSGWCLSHSLKVGNHACSSGQTAGTLDLGSKLDLNE